MYLNDEDDELAERCASIFFKLTKFTVLVILRCFLEVNPNKVES